MDLRMTCREEPEAGEIGWVEQLLLAAVKLASLPFFLLAIALACIIYGVAGLARQAAVLRVVRRPSGTGRVRDRAASPQDA